MNDCHLNVSPVTILILNYFSEKEFEFRPAMLATMRKGLQVVKTDNYFSKKGFDFRTATLGTVRKGLYEKDSSMLTRL